MPASDVCRVFEMLARLNGNAEEDTGCIKIPTNRVLMRVEPLSGIRIEVLAEICHDHFVRLSESGAFVNHWPIRDRTRPDPAATSPAAGS